MQQAGTKAQIRAVAVELFTAHGYEKTSLREIADRVGITKASLYYHFASKQALLQAVLEPLAVQWRRTVEAAVALPYTGENVQVVLAGCLDTLLQHRLVATLLLRDTKTLIIVLAPLFEELIGLNARLHTWLAGPEPSAADRLRAAAATEVLGVALSPAGNLPGVSDEQVRSTLLAAAHAVLARQPIS